MGSINTLKPETGDIVMAGSREHSKYIHINANIGIDSNISVTYSFNYDIVR